MTQGSTVQKSAQSRNSCARGDRWDQLHKECDERTDYAIRDEIEDDQIIDCIAAPCCKQQVFHECPKTLGAYQRWYGGFARYATEI